MDDAQQTRARREKLWLAALVALGVVLRLGIAPHRWINPDEGAHLMDARLLLDGLVPSVDYGARQPFYVLLLAGWVRLFGVDHAAVRFFPLLVNCGSAVLAALLARRLFGRAVGVVTAALLLFFPFAVVWSTIVHTQPFTVALCTLGMLLVVRALRDGRGGLAAAAGAGAVFALGFYVRESSLALPLAAVLTFFTAHPGGVRRAARATAAMLAGFVAIVGVALLFYARYMTAAELWASGINPLSIAADGLDRVVGALGLIGSGASSAAAGLRDPTQDWSTTVAYLRQVVWLNAPLLVGGLVGPVYLILSAPPGERRAAWRQVAPAVWWAASLALLYGYWILHRGFYPQYFAEFLPPLAILTAAAGVQLARRMRGSPVAFAATLGAVGIGVMLVHQPGALLDLSNVALALIGLLAGLAVFAPAPTRVWHLLAAAVVIALDVAGARVGERVPAVLKAAEIAAAGAAVVLAGPRVPRWDAAVAALLAGAVSVTAAASGRLLSPAYECVWSPATVRAVASYIAAHSEPTDRVLSGAVIWDFQSGRRPLANITHPLSFLGGIDPVARRQLRAALATEPPRFVVLDGYTERTYLARLPELRELLEARYMPVGRFDGSAYPVTLMQLAPSAAAR